MRRDADYPVLAQPLAGEAGLEVLLADVHAVRAGLHGDVDGVVYYALDAVGAADGDDLFGLVQKFIVLQVLFAHLHEGRAASDGGLNLAADALGAVRPGPVRHGVEPELRGVHFHSHSSQTKNAGTPNKASLRQKLQYFPTLALSKSGRVEARASSQPSQSSPVDMNYYTPAFSRLQAET